MAQPVHRLRRKVLVQAKLRQRTYNAVKAAVVNYGFRPVKTYVRMTPQLAQRSRVHVQPPAPGRADVEIRQGRLRKAADFKQLRHAVIPAQPLAVAHYGTGEAAAYARHTLKQRRIGGI